jgi:hypothetical protein
MKTSEFGKLNLLDLGKGLLMAVLTPAVMIVQQSLNSGEFVFNWNQIAIAAFAGGFAYIVKNLLTPSDKKE